MNKSEKSIQPYWITIHWMFGTDIVDNKEIIVFEALPSELDLDLLDSMRKIGRHVAERRMGSAIR